jgi:L-idonate 5-dehydrogenase
MRYRCFCLVIHAAGDLRLTDQRDSAPGDTAAPGAGEVLVRVGFGGICGSDLHYWKHGGFGTVRLAEPMVLGHEVAGTVEAVGEGVAGLAPGDRVAVNPSRPCAACRYCLEGLPNQCLEMRFYGSAMRRPHVQGAFRQRLLCGAVQCVKLHSDVPLEHAAMAEPFAVALHAVSRAGSLLGKRVLVTGCGPIGALCVVAARAHGAAEVTATDVVPEPLATVRALGAEHIIDAGADPAWADRYAADKGTFDVLFECSGHATALQGGITALRPRGVVVQLGLGGDVSVPQNAIVAKELTLCGSFRFHAEFALAVRLIDSRRVDLAPMLTGRFPLAEADAAFALAADRRRAMKVLLDFGGDTSEAAPAETSPA